MFQKVDSSNRPKMKDSALRKFYGKIRAGLCNKTGKSIGVLLEKDNRHFQKSPQFDCSYLTITGNFAFFNTLTLKQLF